MGWGSRTPLQLVIWWSPSSLPALDSVTTSSDDFGMWVCLLGTQHMQDALSGGLCPPTPAEPLLGMRAWRCTRRSSVRAVSGTLRLQGLRALVDLLAWIRQIYPQVFLLKSNYCLWTSYKHLCPPVDVSIPFMWWTERSRGLSGRSVGVDKGRVGVGWDRTERSCGSWFLASPRFGSFEEPALQIMWMGLFFIYKLLTWCSGTEKA